MRLRRKEFDLNDFLHHLRQMEKLGSIENLLSILPGGCLQGFEEMDTNRFRRIIAIICAMTATERHYPDIIDLSRRRRIAQGSGVQISEVNNVLNWFFRML